jgi:hypothetical protein
MSAYIQDTADSSMQTSKRSHEETLAELMGIASKFLGFEVTADNYRSIAPEKAAGLLQMLSSREDFRELALTRGTAFAEANIWLAAQAGGTDLPIEHVTRASQGFDPTTRPPDDGKDVLTDEGLKTASQKLTAAANAPTAAASASARARLATLSQDPAWREKALTRGTSEARENLELNATISGVVHSPQEMQRLVSGLGPSSIAPPEARGADAAPWLRER